MDSGTIDRSARAEWHRQRAVRERYLAAATIDPDARNVHLTLAKLHERASAEGYTLQVAGDR